MTRPAVREARGRRGRRITSRTTGTITFERVRLIWGWDPAKEDDIAEDVVLWGAGGHPSQFRSPPRWVGAVIARHAPPGFIFADALRDAAVRAIFCEKVLDNWRVWRETYRDLKQQRTTE